MVHPDTALKFINEAVGHGLVATRPIPRGSLVWVKDDLDQVVAQEALAALPAVGRETALRYSSPYGPGALVLFWDHARFINHSCSPASLVAGGRFSIAVRDIAAGEEITEDYACLSLFPDESFTCHCGSSRCRGRIGAGDAAGQIEEWSEALREALALMSQVPQPLRPLMRDEYLSEAHRAAA